MDEYIFLFRNSKNSTAMFSEEELNSYYAKWGAWFDKMNKEGKYISGDRLMSEDAKVLSGNEILITDGPFVETKEIIGGFAKIRAANIKEALELAKGCPIFLIGGSLELRKNYK